VARGINPVLARELRERMRTGRTFVVIGAFVSLLILTVYLVYQGTTATGDIQTDLARQTRLGRDVFEWVMFVMLCLVLFFIPGLTAGAVAGERERQTLLPLQVTLLRPRSILVGKVLASSAFLLLLIVTALPVVTISYLLGGITLLDGLQGIVLVAAIAALLTVMVVALSAFTKRVQTATVLAYGFTALLVGLAPLLLLTMSIADRSSGNDEANPPAVIAALNPISILADGTAGASITDDGGNPLRIIRADIVDARTRAGGAWMSWFPDDPRAGGFRVIDRVRSGFPAWAIGLITLSVVALIMATVATRRLRTPAESER
jgi:ABC-type transport system involved in multi-copper enzyme maturation permease subunit